MAQLSELYAMKFAAIDSAQTLCDLARPLIQAKARRLIRGAGFTQTDAEDIEQEATLRLLQRYQRGVPGDWHVLTIIKRVVGQSIANQIRDRTAHKRDYRAVQSLDTSDGDETGHDEWRFAIGQTPVAAQYGPRSREAQELIDLGIDIKEMLAAMSKEQRELCQALGIHSITELARNLRQPRSTLQDKVRKLRCLLKNRGLRRYFASTLPKHGLVPPV